MLPPSLPSISTLWRNDAESPTGKFASLKSIPISNSCDRNRTYGLWCHFMSKSPVWKPLSSNAVKRGHERTLIELQPSAFGGIALK